MENLEPGTNESPFVEPARAALEAAQREAVASAAVKTLGPIAVEAVAAEDMIYEGGPVAPEK